MRKLKKLLKWTALVVLAGLVIGFIFVGFSFVERGALADQITRSWGLPVENHSLTIQIERDKEESTPRADRIILPYHQGEIDPLNDQVQVTGSYTGDIKAKKIDVDYGVEIIGNLTAEHININHGEVYGDLTSARLVKIDDESMVTGNIRAGDGAAEIAGEVRGNVEGKQVILRSTALIHGDIITSGQSLMIEPGAEVSGTIANIENKPLKIMKGSWTQERKQVRLEYGGERTNVVVSRDHEYWGLVFYWLPVLLGLLALLLLVYTFLNSDVQAVMDHVTNRPWKSLWTGILSLAVAVPVGFVFALTIIGIPLALALAVVVTAAFTLGLATIGSFIGQKVCDIFHLQFNSTFKETLLGMFLLVHLVWVPVLGWFALFVLSLMGFGAVVPLWWPRFKNWWKNRKKKTNQAEPEPEKAE